MNSSKRTNRDVRGIDRDSYAVRSPCRPAANGCGVALKDDGPLIDCDIPRHSPCASTTYGTLLNGEGAGVTEIEKDIKEVVRNILRGGYLEKTGVRGKGDAVLYMLVNEGIQLLESVAEELSREDT